MSLLYGISAQHQGSGSAIPHILSHLTTRTVADDGLFEVRKGAAVGTRVFRLTMEGQIQGADGTLAKPTYAFANDKTSGLHYVASNNLGLVINGVKVVDYSAAAVAITGSLSVSTTTTLTGVTTHGGNVVSDSDSTDDLGTTGVRWANLYVDDVTVTTTVTAGTSLVGGTMTMAGGSLTDSSGAISFGNENLTTTGTLASGTTTIGSLVLAAASITDSSGAISFGNENLTTTGTLASGALTATTITGSGILSIDDTTDTSSTTTGSVHTDGGLGVAKALWIGTTARIVGAATLSSTLEVTSLITATAGVTANGLIRADFAGTDKLLEIVGSGAGGTYMKFTETGSKGFFIGIDDAGTSLKFREDTISGSVSLELDTSGNTILGGSLTIAGDAGFYGQAATAKPTGVAVSAAGIHAALVTLNLISA